jgi:hypothetical protein
MTSRVRLMRRDTNRNSIVCAFKQTNGLNLIFFLASEAKCVSLSSISFFLLIGLTIAVNTYLRR